MNLQGAVLFLLASIHTLALSQDSGVGYAQGFPGEARVPTAAALSVVDARGRALGRLLIATPDRHNIAFAAVRVSKHRHATVPLVFSGSNVTALVFTNSRLLYESVNCAGAAFFEVDEPGLLPGFVPAAGVSTSPRGLPVDYLYVGSSTYQDPQERRFNSQFSNGLCHSGPRAVFSSFIFRADEVMYVGDLKPPFHIR